MSAETTFLFGAGASSEAGVPTVRSMVQEIEAVLRKDREWKRWERAYNVAMTGLQWYAGNVSQDTRQSPDIEDLFRVLKDLGNRRTSFLGAFVGSWREEVSAADSRDLRAC